MAKTEKEPETFAVNHETVRKTGSDQSLSDSFKQFIKSSSHDAAVVGIASIDRFDNFPKGHGPRDFIPKAKAVIVIALPIVEGLMGLENFMEDSEIIKEKDTYIDDQGNSKEWSPRVAIRGHIESRNSHEIINIELQTLSMYGAIFLEKAGFKTLYLPTTYGNTLSWPVGSPRAPKWYGPFSHRHAAVAAGIGEFGLNNLLLTAEYGPRVRLVSIITEAPLIADPVIQKNICLGEKCSLCVKSCPANAFSDIYEVTIGGHLNRLAHVKQEECIKKSKSCYKKCVRTCPIGLKFNGDTQ